jgi:hypothetical protein
MFTLVEVEDSEDELMKSKLVLEISLEDTLVDVFETKIKTLFLGISVCF